MKVSRIDIRVSPETKEEWCGLAKEKGLSLTELIMEAMANVHTDTVHTEVKKSPLVHTPVATEKKVKVKEVIKEIESKWGGSMFKDSKLNKF
jgi:hypothetical protein